MHMTLLTAQAMPEQNKHQMHTPENLLANPSEAAVLLLHAASGMLAASSHSCLMGDISADAEVYSR